MTIDEAIKHCEEVAERQEEDISKWEYTLSEYRKRECVEQTTIPRCEKALNRCKQCVSEHRQLAEWLRDYKRLKEQEPSVSENPNNCEIRDATLEERESIDKYIKSISKPTGVKFGALEQEPSGDIKEIEEVINCDADAETKCKMISNILTAKQHYFKEQEPTNKIVQKAYEDGKKDGYVQAKLEQEPTVTSTNNSGEMIYPQVEGITPMVVEPIGDDYKYIKSISNPTGIEFDIDIPKKIESYEKLLKHPVMKHIMDMDEEQEQIDFVQPHKQIPVTLAVGSGDLISRRALQEWIKDKSFGDIVVANEHNFDCLSSIKSQSCEDTISRQAVMDYIHRILNQGTGKKKSFEFIQKYVKKLPSVKPQIQTGHWEIVNSFCTCDQCGYETRPWNNTLFCPNCGARMESEKNE